MFLTVYFSMDLCLFLYVLPSEVFRTTRAATRVQPAIRAFHCNRVISPSLQSGWWSRLGRLGRSFKGSREPRHSKRTKKMRIRKNNENLSAAIFVHRLAERRLPQPWRVRVDVATLQQMTFQSKGSSREDGRTGVFKE